MTTIEPLSIVTECPTCEGPLTVRPLKDSAPTSCSKCAYTEPQGSAHICTIVSRCLLQQLKEIGVQEVVYRRHEMKPMFLALPNGLLPVLANFGNQTLHALGLEDYRVFSVIDDQKGLVGKRVTANCTGEKSNATMAMAVSILTLDYAHDISMSLSNSPKERFDLDSVAQVTRSALHAPGSAEVTLMDSISAAAQQIQKPRAR